MNDNERVVIREIKRLQQFGYSDEDIIKEFESKILKLNSVALSLFFAKNVKGVDVKVHEKVIIDSKNLEYNYLFAKDVVEADIEAHGQVIINSQDVKYNYEFACNVLHADIKKHGKIIRKSKNSFYQKKFMAFTKRDDFSQVQVVNNTCSNEISQCKEKINCSLDSILKQKKKVRVKK